MTDALLSSGQLFASRYRIERLLARGGFGAVYVAEQLATEAQVALKVLWPHVLVSEAAVASFEQEARIAGRVRSHHIVRVLDAGIDGETSLPFLVMELLSGRDLERLVEQTGPVSSERTVALMRQAASALDRAHGYVDRDGISRPIVHRDLKPENLFVVQSESGEETIKILDFGIAKMMSATAKQSHEVKGTPLYMAYEQAAGGAITPQTDIWALGLIVFYMLTGRSYWRAAGVEGASLTLLFGEVLSLPIVPPSERLAEFGTVSLFPPGFDRWFLRCVNRDSAERFATAGEAISALSSALGLQAVPMSAYSPTVRSSLPEAALADTWRTPGPAPAAWGSSGPAHSGVASAPEARGTALNLSISGAAPRPRSSRPAVIALVVGLLVLAAAAALFALLPERQLPAVSGVASGASAEPPVSAPVPSAVRAPAPVVAPEVKATAATPSTESTASAQRSPPDRVPSRKRGRTSSLESPTSPPSVKPEDPYHER